MPACQGGGPGLRVVDVAVPISSGEITSSFRSEFAAQLANFELEKVRVFAADATVVFSSDPFEEGTRNTRPYFRKLEVGGRTHAALVPRAGKTLEGRTVQAAVVEIHVPALRERDRSALVLQQERAS